MTKNELARELAVSEKLHLSTAVKAVDGIVRIIKDNLAKGEEVTLQGFGTLSPVKREQRSALHFKTKEPIIVPAHTSVKFKISKDLKNTLNNGNVD